MFIVIDGPNGAGKTALVNSLGIGSGITTIHSPNTTKLSKFLRPVCRGTEPWLDIDPMIQMLCFSAARYDEYDKVVKDNSDLVVADRWWTSTFVYQCCLQRLSIDLLEETIHPKETIDYIIILTADNDTLLKRVKTERLRNPTHGRCSWTNNDDTIIKIAELYRDELPRYLMHRNIPCKIVDTSNRTQDDTMEFVRCLIDGLGIR